MAEGMSYEFDEARAALQSATSLHAAGEFTKAVPFYIRAVKLAPNDPDILYASGIALGQAGKARESVKHLSAALRNGRNTADVWNSLGMAFTELRKLGNAERCFRQVIRMDPTVVSGWINYGNYAYAGGDPTNGAKRFDKAVSIRAKFADDGFTQSLVWLLRGQWRLGWRAYEIRRKVANWRIRNRQNAHLMAKEIGRSQIKRGMRILVEAEQGQGDGVMAARFIKPFADLFGVTVVVQAHDALVDLLRGALPGFEVVDRKTIPHADGWVPMLSLPYFVGVDRPRQVPPPILPFGEAWSETPRPVPARNAINQGAVRRKLRLFVHGRGNAAHSYDFDRSVPRGELLERITKMDFVEAVGANYATAGTDGTGATLMLEPTWRETVDQLLTCDRCLTVDTGLAHVAGSLGIPTDLMIPTMPEFRWGLDKTTTCWYPSVTLRRRTHTDAWAPMIEQIARDYEAL